MTVSMSGIATSPAASSPALRYLACWILTRASACLSGPMFLSARSVPPTRDSRELPRPEKSDDVLVIMQRCKDKRPAARPNLCG
jgi:hypothetical protein